MTQLAWLALLGLWIYWYVTNYIIFEKVGDQLAPQVVYDERNVVLFVGGLVLLVGISFTTSLIFRHLNVQLKLTKLYDNFIANVTHELKSPLSSIQLYLETLLSRNVSEEKRKEFITHMMKDASRLNDLINSILEISAMEQKKVAYDYQIYPAEDVIRTLVNESMEQLKLTPESVIIKGRAPCECVVDKNAFKIVIDNLFDNAVKYSESQIQIIVTMKCFFKKFVVEVKDNGIGIAPSDQKYVFHKFQRIYDKNIPNVKGSGLGLYWVKEIIRFHGGKISVQKR